MLKCRKRTDSLDVDSFVEEDRRLFVGMLGKTTSDDELRDMFEPFGNMESCFVLREKDGSSRGKFKQTYSYMPQLNVVLYLCAFHFAFEWLLNGVSATKGHQHLGTV